MNRKLAWTIAASLLTVSGCFSGGSGGDGAIPPPPPAPPPSPPPGPGLGGLWQGGIRWEPRNGVPGGTLDVRALIAETGEFRLVLYSDWEHYFDNQNEQIFGTFDIDPAIITTLGDAVWAVRLGAGNSIGDLWASFGLAANYSSGASISGSFQAIWTNQEERIGTLTLHYHSLYERPSSLDILQGTYTTADDLLTIDDKGEIFYQSSVTGCTGNGSAEVIDPKYNMYRVEIGVDGCTGDEAARNGLIFTGLANIGVNNDSTGGFLNSTLEMAVSALRGLPFSDGYVPWSLLAHKS